MNDINELALLVSKAKASVFTLEYISQFEPADIDSDDVDLRFEVDGREAGTNVSIVDECGHAAKVIGALIEALEAKDARIAELENDEVRQRLANAEHQLYMAELAKNNLRASRMAQFRKRRDAEKRLAELELNRGQLLIAHRTLLNQQATIVELQSRTEAAEVLAKSHKTLRDSMAAIHNTIRGDGAYVSLSVLLSASQRAYEESAQAAKVCIQIQGGE